jgi:hypothetical protein
MCIVIDINALHLVFKTEDNSETEFAPVRTWIRNGKGSLVYGGSRYKRELKKAYHYLRIVRQLKDKHEAYEIEETEVDRREAEIIKMTKHENCNDQHIIAILSVSRCLLCCSLDSRAYNFITDRRFYAKGMKRPKIYRSSRNRNLLCDKFIVPLRHVV